MSSDDRHRTARRRACRSIVAAAVALAELAAAAAAGGAPRAASPAPASFRLATFAADPGWLGSRNRRPGCVRRTFAFGWSPTAYASATPGELGGRVERTSTYRAYYAERLAQPATLDDRLSVSGTLRVPSPNGGGVLLGWFDEATSYDWRTPDFLGIRIDGSGTKASVDAEYGTRNTFTPTEPVEAGVVLDRKRRYDFELDYLPTAGLYGAGLIQLTLTPVGGTGATADYSLPPAHRADGATFDHFGLLNVQLDGRPMTVYVGNLVVSGVPVDLSTDPGWEASNTRLEKALDCVVHDRQDFGYSPTHFAGGDPGEIGGVVWRSARQPAWYADSTAPLGLQDALYAEGRIDPEGAAVDSDVFIGWFDDRSRLRAADGTPTNLVAADLGGPSAWGFRLFPVFHANGDDRGSLDGEAIPSAPLLSPKHHPWEWWLCYDPGPDAASDGLLTVGLVDPAGGTPMTRATITVPAAAKAEGAELDRFGIRTLERGGHDAVVYLDDLRYTVAPGDSGPADRCR